ncbi:MAG: DUF1254 domain-containing protein [Dermatophilaceae bacterium]
MTDVRDIARAAVPYGLATVDLHRILVSFALDPGSPEFKAPMNTLHHSRGLADPRDRAVVNLNVDTPYSYAWLDLRGGPVLLTVPDHEPARYMSAQIVDLYSYIVGYLSPRTVSPRTPGPRGGAAVIVRGPSTPGPDVEADATFLCPTELALVLVRTQLFDDRDLPAVTELQDRIVLEPLGPPGEPLDAPAPVDVRDGLDERFLEVLDWMLHLMPRLPEDTEIRDRLAEIGCGSGRLDVLLRSPSRRQSARAGLTEGFGDVVRRSRAVQSSAELFGSREFFAGDHTTRAAGALLGILGNAAEEFLGVGYRGDSEGRPFDGHHDYTIRFAPGTLPPVDAFWSITVYDAEQHLYANELDRYVLGSRQLDSMTRDADGSLTILLRHRRPAPELVANWLPCPRAPFGLVFRTYLPREVICSRAWSAPPVIRTS